MIGPRALKIDPRVAINEGLVPDDHRVNEGSLARRPKFVHLGNDTAVDAGTVVLDTASGEAGDQLNVLNLGRAQRRNPVCCEVAFIVKGSRIAEISWRP